MLFFFFVGLFCAVLGVTFLLGAFFTEQLEPIIGSTIFGIASFFSFKFYKENNKVVEKVVQETPDFNLGEYMSELFNSINWWYVGIGLAAYVIIGILWATWKWYKLSLTKAKELREYKKENPNSNFSYSHLIPRVKENKARIIGWMSFWPINAPFDIAKYILCDLLVDFWNQIYKSVAAYFTSITKNAFGEDYIDDNKNN